MTHNIDGYSESADNLEALLGMSVELARIGKEAAAKEQAMKRHPSASGDTPGDVLTAVDRCDTGCGAAAVYRARHKVHFYALDFCLHHWAKNIETMTEKGLWEVSGANQVLLAELHGRNRLQGQDHA